MKRLVLIILFLSSSVFLLNLQAQEAQRPTVTIGSFNTLRLGHQDKDWGKLAQVIRRGDIVALEEVMTVAGLEKLMSQLRMADANWTSAQSPLLGRGSYRESYAFVWRKNRVRRLDSQLIGYPDPRDNFSREPYAGFFQAGKFDFLLVACHLIFNPLPARVKEIKQLSDVYQFFQKLDPVENDVIVVGDFNAAPDNKAFDWTTGFNLIPSFTDVKTTIGIKWPRSQLYDNILVSSVFTKVENTGQCQVYEFDKELFAGDFQQAKKGVSDHLFISCRFYTDKDDD